MREHVLDGLDLVDVGEALDGVGDFHVLVLTRAQHSNRSLHRIVSGVDSVRLLSSYLKCSRAIIH